MTFQRARTRASSQSSRKHVCLAVCLYAQRLPLYSCHVYRHLASICHMTGTPPSHMPHLNNIISMQNSFCVFGHKWQMISTIEMFAGKYRKPFFVALIKIGKEFYFFIIWWAHFCVLFFLHSFYFSVEHLSLSIVCGCVCILCSICINEHTIFLPIKSISNDENPARRVLSCESISLSNVTSSWGLKGGVNGLASVHHHLH